MSVDPSLCIMGHPSRMNLIRELQQELPADANLALDQHNNRWDTGRRALLRGSDSNGWHIVIQDDVILCDNFLHTAQKALENIPIENPVSFYTGKARPFGPAVAMAANTARILEDSWLKFRGPLWGPAVAIHGSQIEGVVEQADALSIENYDLRLTVVYTERGLDCFYSVPSLVDHRVGPGNESLVPGRNHSRARTAHYFERDVSYKVWDDEFYEPKLLQDLWFESPQGKQCSQCGDINRSLAEAISHSHEHLDSAGEVKIFSADREFLEELEKVWSELPENLKGEDPYLDFNSNSPPWLVVVGCEADMEYVSNLPAVTLEASDYFAKMSKELQGMKIKVEMAEGV